MQKIVSYKTLTEKPASKNLRSYFLQAGLVYRCTKNVLGYSRCKSASKALFIDYVNIFLDFLDALSNFK